MGSNEDLGFQVTVVDISDSSNHPVVRHEKSDGDVVCGAWGSGGVIIKSVVDLRNGKQQMAAVAIDQKVLKAILQYAKLND
jgi:hypothetical protein